MNQDPTQPPAGANPLLEEAIGWCLRMQGEDADAHQADFEAWLALGGVHRQIYSEVSELYGFGETLRDTPIDRMTDVAAAGDRSRDLVLWRSSALILAVVIAMVVGGLTIHGARKELASSAPESRKVEGTGQIQTALGEIRTVRLSDGSTMILDTDSLVTVAVDGNVRRLRLERGRARFAVSREKRPFLVTAGAGAITALGTLFDVGLTQYQTVSVSAVRGAVDIRAVGKWSALRSTRAMRIAGGYRASYGPDERMAIVRMARGDLAANAWPSGLMSYDGVPLSEVIRQANRYGVIKIGLSGAALGERRFHGTLRLNDTRRLAFILAHAFSLRVDEEAGTLRLSVQ
jgi:transmembrane sensor